MGAKFVKDVLYPGTYRLADGRKVTYSADDVRGMSERLNEWKRLGLHVPASWAHQKGAKPRKEEQLAEKERNVLGYADESRLTPDGAAEIVLDVPDAEDARQVPKVRFVSPEIVRDWIDGDGKLWPGPSITHIAFTSRPVQHRQQDPVRLSSDIVWLSLGDVDMAEEKEDKPDKKKKGKEGGGGDEGGAGAELKDLIEALRGAGLTIPDEVQDIQGLIIAVKASGGEESNPEPPPETPPTEAPQEGAGPMMMSLQQRAERAEAALVDVERKSLERRIAALAQRGVTKAQRDKLLQALKTEQLSLDDSGKLKGNSVLAQVQFAEGLPIQFSRETDGTTEATRPHRPDEHDEDNADEMRKRAKADAARVSRGYKGEQEK